MSEKFKLKLAASTPVETLREQVREAALNDSRFASQDQNSITPWVCDLIAPDGNGPWQAIITAAKGKLYQVDFTTDAGKVRLGATSVEVFRKTTYLPMAAKAADKETESTAPLRAREFSSPVTAADDLWMFAPGGVHTITPAAGDGSATVTLRIDENAVPILNASLAKLNSRLAPQKVFIDREHDEASGATAWPEEFVWRESPQPGVYMKHQASDLGRQLVEGHVIRAFSPSIYSDADLPKSIRRGQHINIAAGKRGSPENPARIIGLVAPAIGTLTNNPAFKKILPLWANNAGASRSGTEHQTTKK